MILVWFGLGFAIHSLALTVYFYTFSNLVPVKMAFVRLYCTLITELTS